ncbi:type II toxin-antitoxin system HicA family toxin [Methylobacterium nonmethylotrophicum]|uniref:Type II toxin-antitoxin system HicA family toxin n=1 Tax=Methylobacterium nonmethylotrophicum TaxID=1141884 RepID=A0A4Z0NEK3_9HYPH|nr:type II toxin-antitoxin system HicA family toxin [Methylobacterium nonmethylotrophicum]TGD94610.1 type II toxin-antitoxin system HicA family toxin [Methylobacterium nonmethylotrophicum]
MDSGDLIGERERDGWSWHSTTGSHRHFKHPTKPGKVTVPHPKKDRHPKTVKSIRKAAGLQGA